MCVPSASRLWRSSPLLGATRSAVWCHLLHLLYSGRRGTRPPRARSACEAPPPTLEYHMEEAVQEVRRILCNNTSEEALSYLCTVSRSIEDTNANLKDIIGGSYRSLIDACGRLAGMEERCQDLIHLQKTLTSSTPCTSGSVSNLKAEEGLSTTLANLKRVAATSSEGLERDEHMGQPVDDGLLPKRMRQSLLRLKWHLFPLEGLLDSQQMVEVSRVLASVRQTVSAEEEIHGDVVLAELRVMLRAYEKKVMRHIREAIRQDADLLAERALLEIDGSVTRCRYQDDGAGLPAFSSSFTDEFISLKDQVLLRLEGYTEAIHVLLPLSGSLSDILGCGTAAHEGISDAHAATPVWMGEGHEADLRDARYVLACMVGCMMTSMFEEWQQLQEQMHTDRRREDTEACKSPMGGSLPFGEPCAAALRPADSGASSHPPWHATAQLPAYLPRSSEDAYPGVSSTALHLCLRAQFLFQCLCTHTLQPLADGAVFSAVDDRPCLLGAGEWTIQEMLRVRSRGGNKAQEHEAAARRSAVAVSDTPGGMLSRQVNCVAPGGSPGSLNPAVTGAAVTNFVSKLPSADAARRAYVETMLAAVSVSSELNFCTFGSLLAESSPEQRTNAIAQRETLRVIQECVLHPYVTSLLTVGCEDAIALLAYANLQSVMLASQTDFLWVDSATWKTCVLQATQEALSTIVAQSFDSASQLLARWAADLCSAKYPIRKDVADGALENFLPECRHLCTLLSAASTGSSRPTDTEWATAVAMLVGRPTPSRPSASSRGGPSGGAAPPLHGEAVGQPMAAGTSGTAYTIEVIAVTLQRIVDVVRLTQQTGLPPLMNHLLAWLATSLTALEGVSEATAAKREDHIAYAMSRLQLAAVTRTLKQALDHVGQATAAGTVDPALGDAFEALFRFCWQPLKDLLCREYASGLKSVYATSLGSMGLLSSATAMKAQPPQDAAWMSGPLRTVPLHVLYRLEHVHRFAGQDGALVPVIITDELLRFVVALQSVLITLQRNGLHRVARRSGGGPRGECIGDDDARYMMQMLEGIYDGLWTATVHAFAQDLLPQLRTSERMRGLDDAWLQLYLDARFMEQFWTVYLRRTSRATVDLHPRLNVFYDAVSRTCDPVRWRMAQPLVDDACRALLDATALTLGLPASPAAAEAKKDAPEELPSAVPLRGCLPQPRDIGRFSLLPIASVNTAPNTAALISGPIAMSAVRATAPSATALNPTERPPPAETTALGGGEQRGSADHAGSLRVSSAAATALRGWQSLWRQ